MKTNDIVTRGGLVALLCFGLLPTSQAQSLGDFFQNVQNALKSAAAGQDPTKKPPPSASASVSKADMSGYSVVVDNAVPNFRPEQVAWIKNAWTTRMDSEALQTLFADPDSQLPREFRDKYRSTNFKDGFAKQDFNTWAQPYINWGENYFLKSKIFVCPACDVVSATIYHYDFQAAAFHLTFKNLPGGNETEVLVKFADDASRAIEHAIASEDINLLPYVSMDLMPPNGMTALAVQVFQRSTGKSLGVARLPAATQEQFDFIQAHLLTRPDLYSAVQVETAQASDIVPLQADAAKQVAERTAKRFTFAQVAVEAHKLGTHCANKATPATAVDVKAMNDPYPDMPGTYIFLTSSEPGADPFILGPLADTPSDSQLKSLKGTRLCATNPS